MENDNADIDTIIGLDVRGQVFYCNKSKLLNANNGSSYFTARFREDSMLDAGLDRVDDKGRDIYALDRDPNIFKYIIEYIDTDKKPIGIGVYEKNKKLWGLVKDEAIYFGLDSLVQLLMITFSCSPEDNGECKGIMYWLGTLKGTTKYCNPYSRGDVDISGWFEDAEKDFTEEEVSIMVQHRPNPEGNALASRLEQDMYDDEVNISDDEIDQIFDVPGVMMGCDASHPDECSDDKYVYIQLLNGASVSPTHYSIRNGACYGMSGDWNLEASTDGRTWDIIHEARGRQPTLYRKSFYWKYKTLENQSLWNRARSCQGSLSAKKEVVCEHMERNQRQTWKVNSTTGNFYTHFRFVSIEVCLTRGSQGDVRQSCLHGVGFEIFGDVREEWGDENETHIRIEQLENQVMDLQSQNKELLNENNALKDRVRQLENKRSAEEACLPDH